MDPRKGKKKILSKTVNEANNRDNSVLPQRPSGNSKVLLQISQSPIEIKIKFSSLTSWTAQKQILGTCSLL